MAETFAASLKAFEKKVKEQALNIIRESAQDVIEDAQLPKAMGGRMPVVTGNLRNSLQSSLNGSGLTSGEQSYILTIASMELGDLVTFGWTAEYALRQEFGFTGTDALGRNYDQPGNQFAGVAAAKWTQFVEANAARIP